MKRKHLVAAGIGATLCLAGTANAAPLQLIDVDFNGTDTDTGATQTGAAAIGLSSGDTWNGVGGSSNSAVPLVDSQSGYTGVTMDFTSLTGADVGSSSTFPTSSPVYPLMRDLLITVGATDVESVSLHGVAAGNYVLFLYANSDTPAIAQARTTTFSANGVTGTSGPNNYASTLILGVNYVKLDVTVAGTGPVAGLLTIDYSNPNTADNIGQLNGFQLIPEPGSLSLLGLGVTGLLAARRRRVVSI